MNALCRDHARQSGRCFICDNTERISVTQFYTETYPGNLILVHIGLIWPLLYLELKSSFIGFLKRLFFRTTKNEFDYTTKYSRN
jgi:hypothetical protein